MTTEVLKLGFWWGVALAIFYGMNVLIAEHMLFVP